eukprot:4837683-Prorocentrum_lima.AAC.1
MEKEKTGCMQVDEDNGPDVPGLAKLVQTCQGVRGKDHDQTKQAQEDLDKAKASRDKGKPQVKRLKEATDAVKAGLQEALEQKIRAKAPRRN